MIPSEFFSVYNDEKTCRMHFKEQREKHYWLRGRYMWQCKQCSFRTTIRSGTIMQHSNLPVKVWYHGMFLMVATKKAISATEMQKQLGLKRYEPVWYMMQKLRGSMANANTDMILSGEIELDEAFFTTINNDHEDDGSLGIASRGRGSKRKSKVFVIVESNRDSLDKGKCGNLLMFITPRVDSQAIIGLNDLLTEVDRVHTDGLRSYNKLGKHRHNPMVCSPKDAGKMLPWVHIAISNAKRVFNGIYHHIDQKYLQNYLDEFVFKFNIRHETNRFEALLTQAALSGW